MGERLLLQIIAVGGHMSRVGRICAAVSAQVLRENSGSSL